MSEHPVHAYIAIGSNLGDRAATVESALDSMRRIASTELVACSPVIETDPVGPPGQRPYLNAVAELRTFLAPRTLLDELLGIEREHGRNRDSETRWGPRQLDLDLLLFGEQVIAEPGLIVPHPRMHEREFVLEPLAALAPDAFHPILRQSSLWMLESLRERQ